MKRALIISAAVILIVLVGLVAFINHGSSNKPKSFYVGVTYGGSNPADAIQLIDRVKNCTNLFVVASGPLQNNNTALEEMCDYAVKSGLDVIVYFGSYETQRNTTSTFIDIAQERWGSHFLGVYYGDEPSGKAIDGNVRLDNVPNMGNVTVSQYDITVSQTSGLITTSKSYHYSPDFLDQITVQYMDPAASNFTLINYFPNGTIALAKNNDYFIYLTNGTVLKQTSSQNEDSQSSTSDGTILHESLINKPFFVAVTDMGNISQFEPYQQLWDSRPFQTMADLSAVATSYVKTQQETTDWIVKQDKSSIFTSDYVLYWWDYQIGYDTVFAELGWNNTVAQEIGLVRGAANLQDKDWGTIITWTYTQPPYLTTGDEMYNEMRLSYESGAKYVVVFNYAEDSSGAYGTLQEQHFQALERFWTDVVQNPDVVHGGIKAEAALVLPRDYGWGMRNPQDTIWGLWSTNSTSAQIWTQLQSKLDQYGSKLDIVYDDPAFPVAGKYSQIYYWNQTG